MEWKASDIDVYLQEREYIDTAVVPLVPVKFGQNMKQAVEQGEFVHMLSMHLERQFKGRMLFIPSFTYLGEEGESEKVDRLLKWEEKIKENGFKYVFYLTSDPFWRNLEHFAPGSILFVPSIPLENMDDQYKHSIMEDQVKQLMKKVVEGWQAHV